jgi:hypothetical protein
MKTAWSAVRRAAAVAAVVVIALGTVACPKSATVAELQADPGRYEGKDVALRGRVTNSYGALGQGAYELDDGTGKIWVVTDRGVPARNAEVRTTGRLQSGAVVGGRSVGMALFEKDRKVSR